MSRRDRAGAATIVALASLAALGTGCPQDNQNPHVLWLAPDGTETKVHLVDQEPDPF